MHERGVNAGEGAASGKNVGHDGSIFGRSVLRKLVRVADDRHLAADRAHHGERAIQECLAAEIQKGFIRTHARTLASGEEFFNERASSVIYIQSLHAALPI